MLDRKTIGKALGVLVLAGSLAAQSTVPSAVSPAAAARFLEQASWGPTQAAVAAVEAAGFSKYIDEQFMAPLSPLPDVPPNVKGREPHGLVKPEDYERVRDDLKARFEATVDDRGKRMATRVFKPQEIYRQVRNLAPDLIVHFDNLYWRSVGKVGYRTIHVQENDTGPDDCNHAQYGAFILAAPGCSVPGQLENVHLLDLAPTLLELGGYDPLPEMQGKSIVRRHGIDRGDKSGVSQNEEEIIRQRLSGLGYV
jgi:hypothetical protein